MNLEEYEQAQASDKEQEDRNPYSICRETCASCFHWQTFVETRETAWGYCEESNHGMGFLIQGTTQACKDYEYVGGEDNES